MMRRGEVRAARRAAALAAALGLALLAATATTFAAAGCGGPTETADPAPFVGRWERVEAGAPDPDFTLTIAAQGDGVSITFANLTNQMNQTVAGTVQDGFIACTMSTGDSGTGATPGAEATPNPGLQAESDLQLSLDGDGQLIVDLVLPDGTLEPIWIYQRADGATPSSSDGMSPSAPGTL